MKKLLVIGLSLASLALGAAQSEIVDGVTWYYDTSTSWDWNSERMAYDITTNATIVKGANAYAGNLVMPSTLGGATVKYIGSSSFKDCSQMTSLEIPSSVESIYSDAFWNCTGLKTMTIPDTVTSMSSWVFEGCTGLESVTLPSGLTRIEGYMFCRCSSLKRVTIPSGVTEIGSGAFYHCSSLESIEFPSGLVEIGSEAFYDCSSLTSIAIPALVNQIGENAFTGCKNIETYSVDSANASYKVVNGFLVSYVGTTLVGIPCGLSELVIPDGVGSFPSSAFSENTNIVSIVIPGSVRTIGSSAFANCTSLQSVTLGEGVSVLEYGVFRECKALRTLVLPSTVTTIGDSCFYNCESIEDVTIPVSLTSLGSYAFYNCKKIASSIVIPAGVTEIPYDCFNGCESLKSVTFPETLQKIGSWCFSNCESIENLTIPASLTSLGSCAFCNCKKIASSIVIPSGVTEIPESCFSGCESLKAVTFPENLQKIGSCSFCNCKKLERADIPDGVIEIDYAAFENCENLTGVKIPSGLTTISEWSFYGCKKITSIDIPDGVQRVEGYAFCECSLSGEVTIPASVTYIGTYAFGYSWGEKRVTSVNFLGAPPENVSDCGLLNATRKTFSRDYGAAWQAIVGLDAFTGFRSANRPAVTIVSAAVRAEDQTVMDVVYKVTSAKESVKVRALAFEDGVRSFTKVIRPQNFIEGTASNIGDAIAANVEHKLTWKVDSDWRTDLAKVKFEVLAVEENLLPFELITIPANTNHAKLQSSWNSIAESEYLDALFWLYADGDTGLTLEDGVLKKSDTSSNYNILVQGTVVTPTDGYSSWYDDEGNYHYTYSGAAAPRYVFEKMGFRLLEGDELEYVKEETRYDLNPDGFRQYAVRDVQ